VPELSQVTYQSVIFEEPPRQQQEGFLQVVVGLGTDVVVREVLFTVEDHVLRLHPPVFEIDLVSTEDDWDIFAHAGEFGLFLCQQGVLSVTSVTVVR
jgi:hypothetical protein